MSFGDLIEFRILRQRPLSASEVDLIELGYGIQLPDDHRKLLKTWGPGAFDDWIWVLRPDLEPVVRSTYNLLYDGPRLDEFTRIMYEEWVSAGAVIYPDLVPSSFRTVDDRNGSLFPIGTIGGSEDILVYRVEAGQCVELLVVPRDYPQGRFVVESNLCGLIVDILIRHSYPDLDVISPSDGHVFEAFSGDPLVP